MTERPKYTPPEVVSLSQPFLLFDVKNRIEHEKITETGVVKEYRRYIEITGLANTNVPILIEAVYEAPRRQFESLTPLNLEYSYPITDADYNVMRRIKKLKQFSHFLPPEVAPLTLMMTVDPEEGYSAGSRRAINIGDQLVHTMEKSALKQIWNTRLQIVLPDRTIATSHCKFDLNGMSYKFFYKGRPFPQLNDEQQKSFVKSGNTEAIEFFSRPGLFMQLPADLSRLNKLQAQFILSKK